MFIVINLLFFIFLFLLKIPNYGNIIKVERSDTVKTKYLFLILSLFLVTGCTEGNTTQHEDGNNTNVVENEKVTTKTPDKREEIKDVIESTLMSNPPIEKLYKDEETGRYIIEILYKKSSLGMSVCASDNQYLAKKFIGDSSIESVQFKCENSEGVFGFVKVSNIGGINNTIV